MPVITDGSFDELVAISESFAHVESSESETGKKANNTGVHVLVDVRE